MLVFGVTRNGFLVLLLGAIHRGVRGLQEEMLGKGCLSQRGQDVDKRCHNPVFVLNPSARLLVIATWISNGHLRDPSNYRATQQAKNFVQFHRFLRILNG